MKNLLNKDRHITRLLVIMAIVLAAMAVLNPSVFYSASNFSSMAVQFPELGFLSIAAALVLMSGGIDLTVIIKDRTMREVARFVAEQLAPMENVLSTGTHFILKKYKDYGVEYNPSEKDKREVMMSW